jgi:hypothetical protein
MIHTKDDIRNMLETCMRQRDELVAALEALLDGGPKAGEPGHIDYPVAVAMARAALAKVQS